jgi:4-hydroxy 2-oxovalerate aldolase
MYPKDITILDCTLRDGGYYNNWDFEPEKAKKLISALSIAGVDIIEVGYKSASKDRFYGLFKYCNENYLSFLSEIKGSEFAFMIDAKEFFYEKGIDLSKLDTVIKPRQASLFTWCRIAGIYKDIDKIPELIKYFSDKGYKVAFNLMGGSLLKKEQILHSIELVNTTAAEVFYIADSFGSMYPEEIKALVKLLKNNFKKKIGIHTHDNQGMAYANTLAAISEGVDFVDSTVTGMGRGAGNLATEQILLGYGKLSGKEFNSNALIEVIEDYILPLKKKYNWGYSYIYMLSGLNNIHPSYCQSLGEGNKYSVSQITDILEKIPGNFRNSFDKDILTQVISETMGNKETFAGAKLEVYAREDWSGRPLLIVAPGPSVKKHSKSLHAFLSGSNARLMECNHTGSFDDINDRILVLFNRMRLSNYLQNNKDKPKLIVTGETHIEGDYFSDPIKNMFFKIGEPSLREDYLTFPDYEAGQFAILLGLWNGVKEIYLAGFDGYSDTQRNEPMDKFFLNCNKAGLFDNKSVRAITPTQYKGLKEISFFAL